MERAREEALAPDRIPLVPAYITAPTNSLLGDKDYDIILTYL